MWLATSKSLYISFAFSKGEGREFTQQEVSLGRSRCYEPRLLFFVTGEHSIRSAARVLTNFVRARNRTLASRNGETCPSQLLGRSYRDPAVNFSFVVLRFYRSALLLFGALFLHFQTIMLILGLRCPNVTSSPNSVSGTAWQEI